MRTGSPSAARIVSPALSPAACAAMPSETAVMTSPRVYNLIPTVFPPGIRYAGTAANTCVTSSAISVSVTPSCRTRFLICFIIKHPLLRQISQCLICLSPRNSVGQGISKNMRRFLVRKCAGAVFRRLPHPSRKKAGSGGGYFRRIFAVRTRKIFSP